MMTATEIRSWRELPRAGAGWGRQFLCDSANLAEGLIQQHLMSPGVYHGLFKRLVRIAARPMESLTAVLLEWHDFRTGSHRHCGIDQDILTKGAIYPGSTAMQRSV